MEDSNKNKEFKDKEIFELLDKAKKQYETYINLKNLDVNQDNDMNINYLKRDINHPLNIVLK